MLRRKTLLCVAHMVACRDQVKNRDRYARPNSRQWTGAAQRGDLKAPVSTPIAPYTLPACCRGAGVSGPVTVAAASSAVNSRALQLIELHSISWLISKHRKLCSQKRLLR